MNLSEQIAKYIIIIFGAFLISVGILMLLSPERARKTLQKAGSTNLINYTEITVRMIPAIALILFADLSRYPFFFKGLGWFMLITSIVLYFVPRKIHHNYSLKWAQRIKPFYFQLISPFALLFGTFLIYATT